MGKLIRISGSLLVIILSVFSLVGQQINIDSLAINLKNADNDYEKATVCREMAWYYLGSNLDSAMNNCDRAILFAEKSNNQFEKANSLNIKGIINLYYGDYAISIDYVKQALDIIGSIEDNDIDSASILINSARYHNTLANAFYFLSDYSGASQNYLAALRIAISLSDYNKASVICSNLGSVYKDWGDFGLAIKYMTEGYNYAVQIDNKDNITQNLTNIGSAYFDYQKYDSAFVYYTKVIPLIPEFNEDASLVSLYINLSDIYIYRNDFENARATLEIARQLIEDTGFKRGYIFYHKTLGNYYEALGIISEAIVNFKIAFTYADTVGEKRVQQAIAEQIHTAYSNLQNYKEAYKYSQVYQSIEDSIYTEESNQKIRELEVKFDVEKREIQIQNLEKEKLYERNLRLLLLGIILLIVISAFFMFRSIIHKRKKQKQLHGAEKKLIRQEKAIVEAKLLQQDTEQLKLNEEIEYKTKQLTVHALNMMRKNKTLQEVLEVIQKVSKEDIANVPGALNNLKLQIKRGINSDKDWELFKLYFEQVNRSFFVNLKKVNPELNQHDLRLAALIRLKLNIKEAASVLNLSPQSIKGACCV